MALPEGIIDTHIHSAPDTTPRLLSDVEVARQATDAGYRAVVLKSHRTETAGRAAIANEVVSGTEVLGGVALNTHSTGGLVPSALETALLLGGRMVWLPTFASANQVRFNRSGGNTAMIDVLGKVRDDGVHVVDEHGRPLPEVLEVIDMVAEASATLATGHISADEIMTIVPEARRRGVEHVMITHPELDQIALSIDQQAELADLGGVWFERVLVSTTVDGHHATLDDIRESIRVLGAGSTILATDFGQPNNATPVDGMQQFIDAMRERGCTQDEIEQMTCVNPATALGLEPR